MSRGQLRTSRYAWDEIEAATLVRPARRASVAALWRTCSSASRALRASRRRRHRDLQTPDGADVGATRTALSFLLDPRRRILGNRQLIVTPRPFVSAAAVAQTIIRSCLICEVIVRRQDQEHCASITRMIRHYVARRAQVTERHPHNATSRAFAAIGGHGHFEGAGIMGCDEQIKFPQLPGDRHPSSSHALPDLLSHGRLPAGEDQRGPDRALPPGSP